MIITGIGHKSRQGKDTWATFVISYLRMNTRNKKILRMGFADILKSISFQLYAWGGLKTKEYYDGADQKERYKVLPLIGKAPVNIWIDIGNHMRMYDNDVWMRALLKGTQADALIITDVRFPNEAQAILDHGGHLVRIDRPGFPGLDSTSDNALNDFQGWTHIVNNKGSLQELNLSAERFAKEHFKGLFP